MNSRIDFAQMNRRLTFHINLKVTYPLWEYTSIRKPVYARVNFPNIYGVHTVESLEMLYFLA